MTDMRQPQRPYEQLQLVSLAQYHGIKEIEEQIGTLEPEEAELALGVMADDEAGLIQLEMEIFANELSPVSEDIIKRITTGVMERINKGE